MPEQGGSGDLGHHFQNGSQVTMHVLSPRPEEYLNGLLKNAYFAACLMLRAVPDVRSAHEYEPSCLPHAMQPTAPTLYSGLKHGRSARDSPASQHTHRVWG